MEGMTVSLLESMGITPALAYILAFIIILLIIGIASQVAIMIKMSAMNNRINMHANHFDVVDKDVEQAKDQSHKAVVLCYRFVNDLRKIKS